MKRYKPADTYLGLRKQFSSMNNLLNSMESELRVYREKDRALDEQNLLRLEACVQSEMEMNAQLTEELEQMTELFYEALDYVPFWAKEKHFSDWIEKDDT